MTEGDAGLPAPAALATLLRESAASPGAPPPARVRVLGEQESQAFCPFCRDELALADRASCLACGTEHHLQCLTEHGPRTVWGCGRPWVTPRVRVRERT